MLNQYVVFTNPNMIRPATVLAKILPIIPTIPSNRTNVPTTIRRTGVCEKTFWLAAISKYSLPSTCVCVCIYVCVYVCVCVCERERGEKRKGM